MIKPQLARQFNPNKDMGKWEDEFWIADEKIEGIRLLIKSDGKENRMFTRGGKEVYIKWLKKIRFPRGLYDGELTVENGISSDVMHCIVKEPECLKWVVFDMIQYEDNDMINDPYIFRRDFLEIYFGGLNNPRIRLSKTATYDRKKFYDEIVENGGEGIILKDRRASYVPGSRNFWIKVKKKDTWDVVITRVGERKGTKAADRGEVTLFYGFYMGRKLTEVGSLGYFDKEEDLIPFIGAVAEVEGQCQLKSGAIRHLHFLKWRGDKNPRECVYDEPYI